MGGTDDLGEVAISEGLNLPSAGPAAAVLESYTHLECPWEALVRSSHARNAFHDWRMTTVVQRHQVWGASAAFVACLFTVA